MVAVLLAVFKLAVIWSVWIWARCLRLVLAIGQGTNTV